jgi:hypothetical protein
LQNCHSDHVNVMRTLRIMLGILLGIVLLSVAYAGGEGPPSFEDRPQVGQPVRFTDAAGHVFQPERSVILTPKGARAAKLPATADRARSEQHLDLSRMPLIGHVFRDRLASGDAQHRGVQVGSLTRVGDTLVLDARKSPVPVEARDLVLTANFPRDGAVSYRLGLAFAPVAAPAGTGRPAGTAWLIGDILVLVGVGYGPAIEDLEGTIGDLLR